MDNKFNVGDKVKITDDIADWLIDTTNDKLFTPAIKISQGTVYDVIKTKNEEDITIIDDSGKEASILACYFDKVNVKESVLDSLHKKQEQLSNQHSDRTEKSQDLREVR